MIRKSLSTSLLILAVIMLSNSVATARTLICKPTKRFLCTKDGCKPIEPQVHAVIDTNKQTYSICYKTGCETNDAIMRRGAIYLDILLPRKALAAKVEITSMSYFEATSIGLGLYTSFGKCTRK